MFHSYDYLAFGVRTAGHGAFLRGLENMPFSGLCPIMVARPVSLYVAHGELNNLLVKLIFQIAAKSPAPLRALLW